MGRLTRDPELRQTASGISVCTFTLAVDRKYRNANGDKQTDFIPIVVWRQQAEFAHQYFRQGSRVLVSGSIQIRSWDDRDGNRRYTTEIIAEELEFADSKKSESSEYSNQSFSSNYSSQNRQNNTNNNRLVEEVNEFYNQDEEDSFYPAPSDDTDLPFDL